MTRPRILAVDGGQSAIRLCHSHGAGPVEVDGVSRGGDTIADVAEQVGQAWRASSFGPVDRIVLGLTTAPADAAGRVRLASLVAGVTRAPEVWVTDDAVTAHAGALSLGWGVSLVAGTGVACLALPDEGPAMILGGHGFLLGDEGGAFSIGREGLRATLRAREGRSDGTGLLEAAERRFGPIEDLPVRLHDDPRAVNAIAQFAPDVLDTAEGGDRVANRIVDEAIGELALLARAGARVAEAGGRVTGGQRPIPVALGGALLRPGTALRRGLEAVLSTMASGPVLAIRSADASPLDGALTLGLAGTTGRYGDLIHVWHEGMHA